MMIVCVLDGMSSPYSSSMILIIHACELLTPFRGASSSQYRWHLLPLLNIGELRSSSPYSAIEELN